MLYNYEEMERECFSRPKDIKNMFERYIIPIRDYAKEKNTFTIEEVLYLGSSYEVLFAIEYLIKTSFLSIIAKGITTQQSVLKIK